MEGVGLWDMHLSPNKNLREKRTDTQSLEAGSFTDTVEQWKEPCTWLHFVIGCSRHRANGPSQPKRPDQQLNCKPTQRSHCLREASDSWTVRSQKMIGAFPPAARQKTDLGDRLYNQKTARVRCCRPAYEITQPLSSQRQLLSFKPLRAWHEQSCRKMGRVHDVRSGESRRGDTSIWVPIGLCDSDGTRSLQSSYRWHGPRRPADWLAWSGLAFGRVFIFMTLWFWMLKWGTPVHFFEIYVVVQGLILQISQIGVPIQLDDLMVILIDKRPMDNL